MKKSSVRAAALKHGWRSGLEEKIGDELAAASVEYLYEKLTIPFVPKPRKRRYTPDFVLLSNGIIVETKGRFVTADRQKHLEVQEQYPHLEIRFVFSNSRARISKQSKTTYAMWCESKGFRFADKAIPAAWLTEPPHIRSLNVIKALMEAK